MLAKPIEVIHPGPARVVHVLHECDQVIASRQVRHDESSEVIRPYQYARRGSCCRSSAKTTTDAPNAGAFPESLTVPFNSPRRSLSTTTTSRRSSPFLKSIGTSRRLRPPLVIDFTAQPFGGLVTRSSHAPTTFESVKVPAGVTGTGGTSRLTLMGPVPSASSRGYGLHRQSARRPRRGTVEHNPAADARAFREDELKALEISLIDVDPPHRRTTVALCEECVVARLKRDGEFSGLRDRHHHAHRRSADTGPIRSSRKTEARRAASGVDDAAADARDTNRGSDEGDVHAARILTRSQYDWLRLRQQRGLRVEQRLEPIGRGPDHHAGAGIDGLGPSELDRRGARESSYRNDEGAGRKASDTILAEIVGPKQNPSVRNVAGRAPQRRGRP